jgi:hypothetical protein
LQTEEAPKPAAPLEAVADNTADFEEDSNGLDPAANAGAAAAAAPGEDEKPLSAVEALQRKFELHKVTPVGNKTN